MLFTLLITVCAMNDSQYNQQNKIDGEVFTRLDVCNEYVIDTDLTIDQARPLIKSLKNNQNVSDIVLQVQQNK